MKKAALIIIIITLVSKVFGFGREIVLSYYYGISNISDAYIVSLIIPTVVFSFFGVAIATGFIPMYSQIKEKRSENEAKEFTNNLINILAIISFIVALVIFIIPTPFVKLFASGLNDEAFALAITFTRYSIFSVVFTTIAYVFKSYLQVKNKQYIVAFVGVPYNLAMFISIGLSFNTGNTTFLPLGIMMASIFQILFIYPFVVKKGFATKFTFNFSDQSVKELMLLSLPVMLGVAVNDINKIVDKTLASLQGEGSISALTYAGTLNNAVQGIFVLSIVSLVYPIMSKFVAKDSSDDLIKIVERTLQIIILIIVPISLFILFYSEEIVHLLYGRGAFDSQSIYITSELLFFYSIGVIFYGLREVLARTFYSLHDTKTPTINATIGVLLNILLNILLVNVMGLNGLALATSISGAVTTILLYRSLKRKIQEFHIKFTLIYMLKIASISLIAILFSHFAFYEMLKNEFSIILFLLNMIIIIILYFSLMLIFKIEKINNPYKINKE